MGTLPETMVTWSVPVLVISLHLQLGSQASKTVVTLFSVTSNGSYF